MHLPDFDSLGNLPEGVYHCDISDLHAHFVAPFPTSIIRQEIFDGYVKLREVYISLGVSATQWVNGSFTTRKFDPDNPTQEIEPGDIDVVTFVDWDVANKLPPPNQLALMSIIDSREATKLVYKTHSMGMPSYPPGHPLFGMFETYRVWWRDRLSRHSPPSKRTPNDINLPHPSGAPRKGFISLTLGDPAKAPKINETRL